MNEIQQYIEKINQRYKLGNATEHTYRGDLQNLLETLLPTVSITNEPRRIKCGAPDFILTRNSFDIGWIEAKNIGQSLDSKEHQEQFNRYRSALHNLIITDYLRFDFYGISGKVVSINLAILDNKNIHALPENFAEFTNLIKDFANYTGEHITSAAQLSKIMAAKARLLANIIENALNNDDEHDEHISSKDKKANEELKEQLKAFETILIHDITPSQFADIYAQTIAYGMFIAYLHDSKPQNFSRIKAAENIPLTNPFLRKFFQYIAGFDLDIRLDWIVDTLADIFRHVDAEKIMQSFDSRSQRIDPVIHFYETFLAEYDPKLRKSRGVWFTPEPVVNFMVRAVDELLKTEFNLKDGLANTEKTNNIHKVQILDPATGTGTFLAAIVKYIYQNKFKAMQGAWSVYIEEHLIPRLNGFEILMASYAMAHLKLDLLLKETHYQPIKEQERFNIYLTNTLEKEHPDTGSLHTFARWLSDEANEANTIKRDTPVMVVIGNPPYAVSSSNKNKWIDQLLVDYKKELNEKNIQPLSDDYIKFIRYGSHFIEKNGTGILAYISNNSFIDGLIHRQMRKHLLETFDSIYILDLHGSNKKKETAPNGSKDENVFDIMQGVSINIFIKNRSPKQVLDGKHEDHIRSPKLVLDSNLARLYHQDLYGLREEKYQALLNSSIQSIAWDIIDCRAPEYFFIAKDFKVKKEYEKFININELFITSASGIKFRKDNLLIKHNFSEEDVKIMVSNMQRTSTHSILKKYKFSETEDWKIEDKRQYFTTCNNDDVRKVNYRPFDYRFTFYPLDSISKIIPRGDSRKVLMQHFIKGDNISLISCRQQSTFDFQHIFISRLISEMCCISAQTKETGYIFPLYLYPETAHQQSTEETSHRIPNLNNTLIKKIAKKLGLTFTDEKQTTSGIQTHEFGLQLGRNDNNTFAPIDILDYIYAVLHSPNYRETYKEFLKTDFPRVPYPDINNFWQLVELGSELRQLHLLESPALDQLITSYPKNGLNCITNKINKNSFELKDNEKQYGQIWINPSQYFDNVPLIAWEFYVGGYQPVQKWLKDRQGRVLSFDDILHYQKMIKALTETARIMQEIDMIMV